MGKKYIIRVGLEYFHENYPGFDEMGEKVQSNIVKTELDKISEAVNYGGKTVFITKHVEVFELEFSEFLKIGEKDKPELLLPENNNLISVVAPRIN